MILYFHGLGSGKDSTKFKLLQQHFGDTQEVVCVSWNVETDISQLLFNLFKKYKDTSDLTLIGSSTGGNYACQFANMMRANRIEVKLVLLNPLLQLSLRITNRPFPTSLLASLWHIESLQDCYLICAVHDEVIDHSNVQLGIGVTAVYVDDTHKLDRFESYIPQLKNWLNG